MTETFYDLLGVAEDATTDEITAAYREKVKETHPDVSDAPDAEERFKQIKRAKEVLTDADRRDRYDRIGHDRFVDTADGIADGAAYWDDDGPMGSESGGASTGNSGSTTGSAGRTTTGGNATGTSSGGGTEQDASTSTSQSSDWQQSTTGGSGGGAGYATRTTYKDQSYDSLRIPLTPQTLIQIGAMFVLYPVFISASLLPAFPLVVNLLVGLCTLFVVVYLLSIPEVAIAVFGAWSVLTPLLFLSLPGLSLFSLVGLLALVACWFPFGLALLTRAALQT